MKLRYFVSRVPHSESSRIAVAWDIVDRKTGLAVERTKFRKEARIKVRFWNTKGPQRAWNEGEKDEAHERTTG